MRSIKPVPLMDFNDFPLISPSLLMRLTVMNSDQSTASVQQRTLLAAWFSLGKSLDFLDKDKLSINLKY